MTARHQDKHYESGTKRNWRRRCWNEIAGRVQNKKAAQILYLPAMRDADRPIAVSKGFSPNNMIAVDIDKQVVKKMRGEGKIAINANLMDVLAAWPSSKPIDVVFADLTHGFNEQAMTMVYALAASPATHLNTIIAFNLLRGREGAGAMELIREQNATFQLTTIHRGIALFVALFSKTLQLYAVSRGLTEGAEIPTEIVSKVWNWMNDATQPYQTTYHSAAGNLRYDTIIYKNAVSVEAGNTAAEVWRNDVIKNNRNVLKAKYKVSAAMAIQQMRNSGRLPASPHF